MRTLPEDLARLQAMPREALQIAWTQHFRSPPPARFSRDLMLRAIAYRLQERALGGLSQTARRMLREAAQGVGDEVATARPLRPAPVLKPGTRLVRDWGGTTHSVLVLDDGFDYRGHRYRSLTEIATLITGAHWSGPRFFGVARTISSELQPARRQTSDAKPAKGQRDAQS